MKNNLSNIPPELQDLPQWVVWKTDKHPRNALTGANASTSDPSTWSSFQVAQDQVRKGRFSGVGFVFTENDPYMGIDLDKVIDNNGDIDYEAQAIIDKMDSYTEISQSGHGLHVIVRGEKPSTRCRKDNIEIYDRGRYFAFTGNLWQDRATIEDRQKELDWLCEETFGSVEAEAAPVAVDDLVLDPDANPPPDKLDVLLKDREFKKTWKHQREDFKSLSEYDLSLAGFAIRRGWEDQEVADLIIAFRRKHGDRKDQEKALRQDYIKRTIASVKPETDDTHVLSLLPFKVVKVIQYGESEAEVALVLDNGQRIDMGSTELFLSARRARAKLWQYDHDLPLKAEKRWREITKALIALKEKKPTVTRNESTRAWLDDYISSRITLPLIEQEGDIAEMFGSSLNSVAGDKEGRLYLRLSDVARYARVHTGMGGVSQRDVAKNLIELGFEKLSKVSVTEEGRRRQINLWVSPPGFVEGVVE